MYKILYNARNDTKRRFMFNILEMNFDLDLIQVDELNKKDVSFFDKYDLIVNDYFSSSRVLNDSPLNFVKPNKILNGSIISSRKTFAGEIYENNFGVKLNIYSEDDFETKKNSVFCKEEHQTTGRYWLANKPQFNKIGVVNQINYGNKTGIYGLYFVLGKLIYSYNYRNDDFFVKLKNVKHKEYYNHRRTMELFGDDIDKFIGMANDAGMDYGRFDVIKDPAKGNIVIDINNAPFGNQVFERDFLKTGINGEASKLVEELLEKRIKS